MSEVYVWGRAGDDQLGIPFKGDFCPKPTLVESLAGQHVTQASTGGKHTAFCTQSGNVLTTGWAWRGQLGHGDVRDLTSPHLVKAFALQKALYKKKMIKVCAGDEHTVALSSTGDVYTFGGSSDGQLGIGEAGPKAFLLQPKMLLPLHNKKIVDIACGGRHTLCVTAEGRLYAFGRGKEGRVGCATQDNATIPMPVISLHSIKIVSVEAGWSHSICLSADGVCFSFGCGRDGALGLGHRENVLVPFMVKFFVERNIAIRKIGAGYSSSAAIDSTGALYTWGFGESAQLGHGESKTELWPKKVDALDGKATTQISFGGFHTLAIVNGRCYSWGVGQHFQLGNEAPDRMVTPAIIPALAEKVAIDIQAGLWHSVAVVASEEKPLGPTSPEPENEQTALEAELAALRDKVMLDLVKADTGLSDSGETVAAAVLPAGAAPPSPSKEKDKDSVLSRFGRLVGFSLFGSAIGASSEDEALVRKEKSNDQLVAEWTEILDDWQENKNKPEVKKMWRRGIPASIRGKAWCTFVPNNLNITPEKFEIFRAEAKERHERDLVTRDADRHQSFFHVIEVDLPRTFPETRLFGPEGPLHESLLDLLRAYTLLNPDLGYVQGMNYVAAHMLVYMDVYNAFVLLSNLFNSHFFQSLFQMDIGQIFKHVRIYEILLQKHCPKLSQRFEDLQIQTEHYLLEWFITAFTKNLQPAVASRIWDSFLVEGEVYLYKAAIAILKLNQKFLLQADFDDCVGGLRNIGKTIREDDLYRAIKQISVPEYIHTYILLANRPPARQVVAVRKPSNDLAELPPPAAAAQSL